jgi:hypothetical protein
LCTHRPCLLQVISCGTIAAGKLTVAQVSHETPAFYGVRKFITAHHWTPALAVWIQKTSSQRVFLKSTVIFSSRQFVAVPNGQSWILYHEEWHVIYKVHVCLMSNYLKLNASYLQAV